MGMLTILEQIILTAIITLRGDAYGVSIRKRARELSGKSIMYGSLYNLLDQLHKKGYVVRQAKAPGPDEGGHERVLYTVTVYGLKALKEAQALQSVLRESLPAFARRP